MLEETGIQINRSTLQKTGDDLSITNKQYDLNKQIDDCTTGNQYIIIDGMRHYEDYTYWKEKNFKDFYLVYVESDPKTCATRYGEKEFQKVASHHVDHRASPTS